jgi:cephalosporin-C deacetylase-like acetyl esterase
MADLDFLSNQVDGRDLRQMLGAYLRNEVAKAGQGRSQANAAARRDLLRARFLEGIGGLPERTPLKARVTGTLEREGYRIEKVTFESQPGFVVTANLYLPKTGAPPYPAILFPLGHETGAKSYPVWQTLLGNFARRGYVALAWDPVGQGERVQLWEAGGASPRFGASTSEHTIQGIQCLVAGDAIARYTVWDGMRALDYLLSRPEVDPKRVGVTGNSGGGTHTAYLAALDDRIHVAAPSCFITSWRRLLDSIGPQDGEQCIPGFLGAGLEHVDFVLSFAPKPYLMLSAIRDFFSIGGARGSYAEARRAYQQAGAADRMAMQETDEGHGYSRELRLASYRWFDRWLKGAESAAGETEVKPAAEEELWAAKTGRVALEPGAETLFTLNRARALQPKSAPAPAAMRELLKWPAAAGGPRLESYGIGMQAGLRIEKFVYESEPGIRVPAVIVSQTGSGAAAPAVLLVHGRGKSAAWPQIESLARRGAVVMAIDARGLGETRSSAATKGDEWTNLFGDYDSAMTAVLLGRSLAGMRAYDIRRGYEILAARAGVDKARIFGAAQGLAAAPLLHAAAAGAPFSGLLLDGMLATYRSVTEAPLHRQVFESLVPGALKRYDLPLLAASLAPKPVWVVDATSPWGLALSIDEARAAYAAAPGVKLIRRATDETAAAAYGRILD